MIGVLAIQGAFREHVVALRDIDTGVCEVRTAAQLAEVDALIIPGGESTTMRMGLERAGLTAPLRARLVAGMPALGTCAGLVVLGKCSPDVAPPPFGLLDVTVVRNGFGRQPFSFETEVTVAGEVAAAPMHGVFIRAPRIESVGDGVEILGSIAAGTHAGEPVIVRQGMLIGCTFHPELTDDRSLHQYFATMVATLASTVDSSTMAEREEAPHVRAQ